MDIKRIYAIFLRQIYLIRGTGTRFVQIFIWIVVDITLWGFISKYLTAVTGGGFSFMAIFIGAVLLWDFSTQVMQGVTMLFFEDVWSRNFLNIFASPLKVSEYVSGLVFVSVGRSILALIVMLLLASLAFGFSMIVYGAFLALFVFILFLFGIALGLIGISIVLRWGPSAEWFIWPIPALLSPFVGVFYPLTVLPPWMQTVGWLLPPSYVFTGVRTLIEGGALSMPTLLGGFILAVVYIIAAYALFLMVYRKAIKTGLIARYSAETVV
jgi:ABC-2 type transport system permease protein